MTQAEGVTRGFLKRLPRAGLLSPEGRRRKYVLDESTDSTNKMLENSAPSPIYYSYAEIKKA
jgi:hypothetical protein